MSAEKRRMIIAQGPVLLQDPTSLRAEAGSQRTEYQNQRAAWAARMVASTQSILGWLLIGISPAHCQHLISISPASHQHPTSIPPARVCVIHRRSRPLAALFAPSTSFETWQKRCRIWISRTPRCYSFLQQTSLQYSPLPCHQKDI